MKIEINMKMEIRQINDIHGNSYPIFDIMKKTHFGLWKSVCTYETFEDAIEWHKNIWVEDKRKH